MTYSEGNEDAGSATVEAQRTMRSSRARLPLHDTADAFTEASVMFSVRLLILRLLPRSVQFFEKIVQTPHILVVGFGLFGVQEDGW